MYVLPSRASFYHGHWSSSACGRFCLTYGQYEWFVKFIASYEDAHCLYIAMEYIPIGDMSKTFKNGYRWKEGDAKVVIEQLLHGLAVMHKEGIIHRDLKPEVSTLPCPKHCSQNLIVARMFFSAFQWMRPPSSR